MTWVLRPGVGRKYSIRRSGGTLFVRRRRSHSHRKAVSMMQTAEDWDSIDSGSLWRPRRGQVSGAVGRLHSEAAMGPAMVVGKVVVENALRMFLVFDDDVVETIRRRVPITRSAKGLAVGERGGVARSLVPSPRTRRWKSAP